MKKLLYSAAIAVFLTAATSTLQVAMSQDLRGLAAAKPMRLKCAVYVGDAGSIRPAAASASVSSAGRPCESYWADDTAEDERESAELRHAAAPSPAATTLAKR